MEVLCGVVRYNEPGYPTNYAGHWAFREIPFFWDGTETVYAFSDGTPPDAIINARARGFGYYEVNGTIRASFTGGFDACAQYSVVLSRPDSPIFDVGMNVFSMWLESSGGGRVGLCTPYFIAGYGVRPIAGGVTAYEKVQMQIGTLPPGL